MREILFRGKRLDNGEWVESHGISRGRQKTDMEYRYFMGCGGGAIVGTNEAGNIVRLEARGDCLSYEVDPATVGQYTGLTDKNGKKVFEGDVVRFTERQLGGKDVPVIEAVEFSEGGFATHRYFLNNWLRNAAKGNCQLQDIEVIGNIHDNPELLE